jgi:hypothetical protein
MFIGYQRSGHSFIGALLDAHPNVSMGMEVDALNLVRLGYSRNQLFYCLIRNSQVFKKKLNNVWTGYSYAVPGQFQGTYEELKVIGDKKGGKSTLRLEEDPTLFSDLEHMAKCSVKVLHVIRNPFDNISTMILRNATDPDHPTPEEFREKVDLYFQKVKINQSLIASGNLEIMDVFHESFLSQPEKILNDILAFLSLPAPEDYIRNCAAAVYDEPHRTRKEISWPEDLKTEVREFIRKIDFLSHYDFDD